MKLILSNVSLAASFSSCGSSTYQQRSATSGTWADGLIQGHIADLVTGRSDGTVVDSPVQHSLVFHKVAVLFTHDCIHHTLSCRGKHSVHHHLTVAIS